MSVCRLLNGAGDAVAEPERELVVLVLQKRLDRAKTRLSGILEAAPRRRLTLQMLRRTLTVCLQLKGVARLLFSGPPELKGLAARCGAELVAGGWEGMRRDIARCCMDERVRGQAALLIVSADMPLMTVADLREVVAAWQRGADVVLAPDRHTRGTNVMLVNSPERFEYSFGDVFGPGSFHMHRSLAVGLDLTLAVIENPRLALDLDLPTDIVEFIRLAPDDPLARFCVSNARELYRFE